MAGAIDSIVNNAIGGRSAEVKRATAVAAALEVIISKCANSPGHHGQVEQEMENLSKYADQIEAALIRG
ncbi:hypothetical protein JJD61_07200 [Pseudomonas carnis]|uniref:Uncharacterized protein n=1 Tax=Pseudomonas carnis TaxID=2487355 RepID=A0ABT5RP30_9PSED|nr:MULTISPECIES: hypothetical protein [Pseudomonas]AMT89825.1 hypothetical protein AYO71_20610 [Pseudomonas koreensis]MBK3470468.1 hypothetical protein [Pseudomonas carnis]MDD1947747.1 hypothetical protein [Pseudomonas carnis]